VKNKLYIWDLVLLSLVWTVPMASEILSLTSCPLTGHLAVLARDHVSLLNTWERSTVATVQDVHATGSAVYGVSEGQAYLYYVTYGGLIKKIGPRQDRSRVPAVPMAAKSTGLILPKASGRTGSEVVAQTRVGSLSEDVAALLSVPLHALPAASVLAKGFLHGRVAGLSKPRTATLGAPGEAVAFKMGDQLKAVQRIRNIFQPEKKSGPMLDLKAFALLLKKTPGDDATVLSNKI
jgi:hypothetical protein